MNWRSDLIYIDNALLNLSSPTCFKDERIRAFYKKILKILKREHIYESQDFMSVFKQFKCKQKDVINFITFFLENNNYVHFDEKTVYKKRSFRQPNNYYKNFLITLIAYIHESSFINFIRLHHSTFLPDSSNVGAFVEEITEKIKKIKDKIKLSESLTMQSDEPFFNELNDIFSSQSDYEFSDTFNAIW